MAKMTLYKPDGGVLEYDGIKDLKSAAGFVTFDHDHNSSTGKYKRVVTTLPALYEEEFPH